jgi:hypothetical protein
VQVHHDEGLAIHIGPEPCVIAREGNGEASAGERAGQVLSPENYYSRNADAIPIVEGNTDRRVIASAWTGRRGQRPWHVRKLLVREPGGPASGRHLMTPAVRIGKARSRSR